jgi:hypothetical protein
MHQQKLSIELGTCVLEEGTSRYNHKFVSNLTYKVNVSSMHLLKPRPCILQWTK